MHNMYFTVKKMRTISKLELKICRNKKSINKNDMYKMIRLT